MTTEVTIELRPEEVDYLHRRRRIRATAPNVVNNEPNPPTYSISVLNAITEALPDPDEKLVEDMLLAYCEAASLPGSIRDSISDRMGEGMRAVLELVREREASE